MREQGLTSWICMTDEPVCRGAGTSFVFATTVFPEMRSVPNAGSAVRGRPSPTMSHDFSRRASPIALFISSVKCLQKRQLDVPDTSESAGNTQFRRLEVRTNVGSKLDEEGFALDRRFCGEKSAKRKSK